MPSSLTAVHPAISYVGQVGQLQDVQLVSVSKDSEAIDDILTLLRNSQGISGVNIQELKQRTKRGDDEL
ncbi:hypothetical protein BDP27DRAFT_1314944 [Rhodocollybia butyracea]|uniref:Uncharacterized protein n=1 Tax=Rhodocollybia butyracea TaxID=206335 RepID=A0A9P5Q4Q1_9AGAR|nr:hypothetical protein BDP27DRAFT_1314944 [Rhodocollybia butyracea]